MNNSNEYYEIKSMNTITIRDSRNLEELFLEPICLSGIINEEIEKNAWHIMISNEICLKQITIQSLENFFNTLIQVKQQQLNGRQATLYIWIDSQALQLCFNILSGIVKPLPFGAKLNIIPDISSIISEFLSLLYDDPFASENITFFDADDEDFDFDAYAEEIKRNFVLDVYVKYLNEDKNSSI